MGGREWERENGGERMGETEVKDEEKEERKRERSEGEEERVQEREMRSSANVEASLSKIAPQHKVLVTNSESTLSPLAGKSHGPFISYLKRKNRI